MKYLKKFQELDGQRDPRPGLYAWKLTYYTEVRYGTVHEYGFAIPDEAAMEALAKLGPILEIGAGTGYWAYEMRKRGIDVIATDIAPATNYGFKKLWTEIETLSALDALQKYPDRVLLNVWPCCAQSWAVEALRAYLGDTYVYVGEGIRGCTGDEALHEELAQNWEAVEEIHIPSWPTFGDRMVIYRRKQCDVK